MTFIKHHIAPFLLALLVCFLLVRTGKINSFSKDQIQSADSALTSDTYYPYPYDINTELWLRYHLKNKSVVIMGSSELTAQTRNYISNKFLSDSLHLPCIAFGKGGNQCFDIFCQLLSFNKELKNARVVVILSPGWFDEYSEGTSAEMFLLYNNRRTLGYILADDSVPGEFKNYIGKYIAKHLPSIDAPDENLLGFYYWNKQSNPINKITTYPFAAFHEFCWNKRNALFTAAYAAQKFPYPVNYSETDKMIWQPKTTSTDPQFHEPDWDSLCAQELNAFTIASSNNTSGIENDYYNTWVKGKALKKIKTFHPETNTEYQDFLMLMKLLDHYDANAYFIIQALNPYAFESPEKLDPVVNALETEIAAHNYKCFNMFTSSKEKYVKGTLNDIMHTGDYGWLLIDREIAHHYFKPYAK